MIDLKALVKSLIDDGQHSDGDEADKDKSAIRAVNGREIPQQERIATLVGWLHHYKVLMRYTIPDREAVAKSILNFADSKSKHQLYLDETAILTEFAALHTQIEAVAPKRKDGEPRAAISLTSKALWLCYPEDVPIFDRNARSALQFISRVCRIVPKRHDNEYAEFLSVWFQVFYEVEPLMTPDCMATCPTKVRVLDHILWWLGENKYFSERREERTICVV